MTLREAHDSLNGDIGLLEYPLFDNAYRPVLNQKILHHYWNQEIGVETPDMFRYSLARRMNEVMPYYNKLYLSERMQFDPFITQRVITETATEALQANTTSGQSTVASESDAKSRAVNSDFPQVMLSGNGDYATHAADSNATNTGNSESTETGESSTESTGTARTTIEGFSGDQSALLANYRRTLLNIDVMVINELRDLFMMIWQNTDPYTNKDGYIYYGY